MVWRTSDVGVEECKGFSPPNDHTTSASSTPLPLVSWDLNTGTVTPQGLRRTESQTSADMARKRARYAQRTEGWLLGRLCFGFIAANAAAEEAARIAARARRARQLLDKEIFRC